MQPVINVFRQGPIDAKPYNFETVSRSFAGSHDFRGDPVLRPALLDRYQPRRLPHRLVDGLPVERADRSQVDHLAQKAPILVRGLSPEVSSPGRAIEMYKDGQLLGLHEGVDGLPVERADRSRIDYLAQKAPILVAERISPGSRVI